MAGQASYYNRDTANPYCEACGSKSWNTLSNCADCEAELCSECGVDERDALLCKPCSAARHAEAKPAQKIDLAAVCWNDCQENWVEMVEFRKPPKRAQHVQMDLDFSREVA